MAKKKLTYEEAYMELEKIVESLENNDFTLDESVKIFKRGMELSTYCSEMLEKKEGEVKVLIDGEEEDFKIGE